ncbi:bifunctional hydroxymethylpyrimidine kinase/phosphomethylpyrimidine kinase [Thalassotalea sp. HSM 43]|uniref:bifunctional hydroxymethylpyrimidine kinase/phosphomethylpyrimidine kinase n=1 Tax=Thalassotalea sp. HSM 43 TaxID=2552945 RepID=UPI0010813F0A|nr:bifunctional hydroxymethylpyrimidine kinase/phosphomethylpyrimidine kinase [Thalassotalea sp. HSM 43]QBY04484.1 bifunctional hydroxymethylpyrimidine kinase/phosphomethylpyrimidine kinase [Thalassotalea sp. HSM 43]
MNPSIVWSVSGSDPTGGAGIQADLKTMHNLGSEACTIITAVTAQNSQAVASINPVSDAILLAQFAALAADKTAQVIKIGMLANPQQVELVANQINQFKQTWDSAPRVVYDPIAISVSGDDLTEDDIVPAIKKWLLPLVDVVTPNNQELQKLTGVYVFSWDCMRTAANSLLDLGVGAVIIKGGHIDIDLEKAVDYCTDGEHHYWLASDRIETSRSHGVGCTFASAIATLLAQDYLLRDAFTIAKAYVNQGLKAQCHVNKQHDNGGPIWQGTWPNKATDFPQVLVSGSELADELDWHHEFADNNTHYATGFTTLSSEQLALYPHVDCLEWCERLLKMGIKTIRYHANNADEQEREDALIAALALAQQYQANMFIDDHWQLAIKHHAYGVHLKVSDLDNLDLAAIQEAGLCLGLSGKGYYDLLQAQQYQPSYLLLDEMFNKEINDITNIDAELKRLRELVTLNNDAQQITLVAMLQAQVGVSAKSTANITELGVNAIAVAATLREADQPEHVIEQLQRILGRHI